MVAEIKSLRTHAASRTVYVAMKLDDLWPARNQSKSFWEAQHVMDNLSNIRPSYQLYWIWLAKSWFVHESIQMNPFQSEIFVWCDIGGFRTKEYNSQKLVRHTEVIPHSSLLIMAPTQPKITNSKLTKDGSTVGSNIAGRAYTWIKFYSKFRQMFIGYVDKAMFLGDDQPVIQSTCVQNPALCAGTVIFFLFEFISCGMTSLLTYNPMLFHLMGSVVLPEMVPEMNKWPGITYALHHGINVAELWYFDGRQNGKKSYCTSDIHDLGDSCVKKSAFICLSSEDCSPSQDCIQYDCISEINLCAQDLKGLQASCLNGSGIECNLSTDCPLNHGCMPCRAA